MIPCGTCGAPLPHPDVFCERCCYPPAPTVQQSPFEPCPPDHHPVKHEWHQKAKAYDAMVAERDALRAAAMDVAADLRPDHEHYEDPAECSLCRLWLVLGLETREEQGLDD